MQNFCRNGVKRFKRWNFASQFQNQYLISQHAFSQIQPSNITSNTNNLDILNHEQFINNLSSMDIPKGYQIIVCKEDNNNNDNSNDTIIYNDTNDTNNSTNNNDTNSINSSDTNPTDSGGSDGTNDGNDSTNNDGSSQDGETGSNDNNNASSGSEGGDESTAGAESTSESAPEAYSMTPTQMMKELDRFVIGQSDAKKAVAVAWRARWRRQRLPKDYQPEVTPKNILMVGPTGCGKTEVARRLARLSDSPFVKVEATKFTEVGYVGKDVNTIIEDLVQHAATLVKQRKKKQLEKELSKAVNDIILKALVGKATEKDANYWRKKIEDGTLDETTVDIDIQKEPDLPSFLRGGGASVGRHPYLIFSSGNAGQDGKTEKKQYPIRRAREILMEQELKKYLSENDLANQALELAENEGIVFIDEIDKICGSRDSFRSERRVSQEGVQRDLLPLIEGCSVNVQNYGKLNTDHILFICAGAFHDSKPSDLMPEFQGRLPVRVELKGLTEEDMHRILCQTEYNLISQQVEMLKTENCTLTFTDEAIKKIARVAVQCNENVENIGARRLVTVIEKIMEEINIDASEADLKDYVIDEEYVNKNLGDIVKGEDLTNFIL